MEIQAAELLLPREAPCPSQFIPCSNLQFTPKNAAFGSNHPWQRGGGGSQKAQWCSTSPVKPSSIPPTRGMLRNPCPTSPVGLSRVWLAGRAGPAGIRGMPRDQWLSGGCAPVPSLCLWGCGGGCAHTAPALLSPQGESGPPGLPGPRGPKVGDGRDGESRDGGSPCPGWRLTSRDAIPPQTPQGLGQGWESFLHPWVCHELGTPELPRGWELPGEVLPSLLRGFDANGSSLSPSAGTPGLAGQARPPRPQGLSGERVLAWGGGIPPGAAGICPL